MPPAKQQEQRVDHREAGEDQVARALLRPRLVGLAARGEQKPVGRDEQEGDQRHDAGQVEHQREGVVGPIGADDEQLDDDVGHQSAVAAPCSCSRARRARHVLRAWPRWTAPRRRSATRRGRRPAPRQGAPTLTKTAPQWPTTASSTAAIDGWRMPAMSARGRTA